MTTWTADSGEIIPDSVDGGSGFDIVPRVAKERPLSRVSGFGWFRFVTPFEHEDELTDVEHMTRVHKELGDVLPNLDYWRRYGGNTGVVFHPDHARFGDVFSDSASPSNRDQTSLRLDWTRSSASDASLTEFQQLTKSSSTSRSLANTMHQGAMNSLRNIRA